MYWQGICSWTSVKLGADFRAYHKFKRSPDTIYISVFRHEVAYFDCSVRVLSFRLFRSGVEGALRQIKIVRYELIPNKSKKNE